MRVTLLSFMSLLGLARLAIARIEADWAQRSIYQTMTDRFALPDGSTDRDCDLLKYCGGTWSGLIKRLDYIQGMGFTAVQISPIVENLPQETPYGEAYHGYWVQNNYALNSHFGTSEDLNNLIAELHRRDMYLILDVVINNMAYAINGSMEQPQNIDYSTLHPFNDKKYYHPYCNITDYDIDSIAQYCWLGQVNVALPDLDTQSEVVVEMSGDWIKSTLSNYSVDAIRIDAAKHVNTAFLPPFVEAANVFTMGEVFSGLVDRVCPYQNELQGLPNYPVWGPLIDAFTAGRMEALAKMVDDVEIGCKDFSLLGTFTENHDVPRFASYTEDLALASNALAFTLLADGIPMVYQGQEQHLKGNFAPYNREALWTTNYDTTAPLYKLTATLNTLRNHAISIDSQYTKHSKQLYLDPATYATTKGPESVNIVAVFSNQGKQGGKYELSIGGGFEPNTEVMEVLNCDKSTTDAKGNVTVSMGQGAPKIFFPMANLNGSGLCGTQKKGAAPTSPSSSSSSSSNSTNSNSTGGNEASGADQVQMSMHMMAMCIMFAFTFWII